MSDTKVVVIPKTADVQDVIQVLSAKGKESGNKGPSKFILLSANAGHGCGAAAGEDGSSAGNSASQAAETTQPFPNKPLTALKTRRCPIFPFRNPVPATHACLCFSSVNRDLECHPLDDSLASIQQLKGISTCAAPLEPAEGPGEEKESSRSQVS